jgi:regulatory protein
MDEAMRWLAIRGRSRAEVAAKLVRRGFDATTAEAVVSRLTDLGILDDRRFAAGGAATGLRRGLSRYNIQVQLEAKGVASEDAAWGLEEAGNEQTDAERARLLAESWMRMHPGRSGTAAWRRLGGLLARKGYDEELVEDVCRSLLGEPSGVREP